MIKRRGGKTLVVLQVLLASLIVQVCPVMPTGGISVSHYYFPDTSYLDYMKVFDINNDSYLDFAELDAVKEIDCSLKGIASPVGIENFSELEVLACYSNELETLDLSWNTELLELSCSHNPLVSLDLSNNTRLRQLACFYTDIDALHVSHLADLTSLACNNTCLSSLDVSKNSKLQILSSYDCHITSLDLSKNTDLSVAEIAVTSSQTKLLSSWNGSRHVFALSNIVGPDKIANITEVLESSHLPTGEIPLPPSAGYDRNSGVLEIDPEEKLDSVVYLYDVKSPTLPGHKLAVMVHLLYEPELRVAVFRTGNKASYNVGETVALAARAEGGKTPCRYQFYVLRSNGSRVILRNYAYSNIFNWVPVNPDSYEVGVNVKDATDTVVSRENTVTVMKPLEIAVFRTGYKSSYNVGETVALAARAEGGSTRYQYQFYAVRSNGARVILRRYASSNIFNWVPVSSDTYQIGVDVRDVDYNTTVNQEKTVTVTASTPDPLAVAVFRAGYKTTYTIGETVALAARGEGGMLPHQYQFHVFRSNGTKVILKNYSGVNIFNWKPVNPDTYHVWVAIRDAGGRVVTESLYVTVK